ncbi:polysaccharide deacetylase family protein [Phenylobacterium sp.]|uniref:polysaccharide deacetylase family protein n=1 Tax=Phenylobacterium sp. TaxID=1871053 RepID=UPI002B795859|nr:polysaccharide deacetylase family protein [Phenylobacterium sp.]HVI31475.1 polysaccharide deacetylase family protein [Phenylobacterium sp.]
MRAWIALAAALLAGPAAAQDMALTFDDLPVHSDLPPGETRLGVIARLVGGLADAGAPPSYGFVNAAGEAEAGGAEALRVWRAAGHPVGNHTWSHKRLQDPAAFEAEVVRNEPALQALGGDWRWFRYPFLDEGATPELRSAARGILKARGYRIASVTLSFHDYAWNGPYARCAANGDQAAIARLEESYLAAADASLARARTLSRQVAGREIPLVLLMHVGAFDARMLPRLLALYRERGVRFVTLETAMADPFYREDLQARASPRPATLEDAAELKGLTPAPDPSPGPELDKVCR